MSFKYIICTFFILGACSIKPRPSVIAFNNVSVTIRDSGLADRVGSQKLALELAEERCGAINKSTKHVSSNTFSEGPYDTKLDHLFACE